MLYPKRLIEVDLPIKRISAHAMHEKSVRHGHISTLHIWWARRPLAACRAVLCASLWPDPADENCPPGFVELASFEMLKWSDNIHLQLLSNESVSRFIKVNHDEQTVHDKIFLRQLLLDFIADFSNFDNSSNEEFLKTSRALTRNAHESLNKNSESKPLVVDPFAGGGSIPLESIRIGAETFASDLNPIPYLLNKVQLEYIPKFGNELLDLLKEKSIELQKIVKNKLEKYYKGLAELNEKHLFPAIEPNIRKNGKSWKFKQISIETPISYIWARTILCEGPNCGAKIPVTRSLWLSKRIKNGVALAIKGNFNDKKITLEIISNPNPKNVGNGTAKRGAVVCPCCGFTTSIKSVRKQLTDQNGGADSSILMAVVSIIQSKRVSDNREEVMTETGRFYRLPTEHDYKLIQEAKNDLKILENKDWIIPNEEIPLMSGVFNAPLYGINTWAKLFTSRQLLSLSIIATEVNKISSDKGIDKAVKTILAFSISKFADLCNSLCRWEPIAQCPRQLFGRQAIPMVWDFAEGVPIGDSSGSFNVVLGRIWNVLEKNGFNWPTAGTSELVSASNHILPDDSVDCVFTDPPYYNAVPYADLSDFFYVWLKRILENEYKSVFANSTAPKAEEICEMSGWDPIRYAHKDGNWFEHQMQLAMSEIRRYLKPNGIVTVVFAHKTTAGWEAMLQSMLNAGLVITASWPIDTEMGSRLRAQGSAALASSVHLICRPRENEDGSLILNQIGDWRDVQAELPIRINEWMPRLAAEGIVGADAIFACLGPALEVFSRYTKVLQAGSEREISLKEFLEKVWSAVSQEALNMVFSGGEAKSLEEDARLTAMWLWTLNAGVNENNGDEENNDDTESSSGGKISGYTLEYDTARKIAQGLGANLEDLKTLIEVKGSKARLLPVHERITKLFGVSGIQNQPIKKKKRTQLSLTFENVEIEEESKFDMPELKVEQTGKTVLDRLHQAMLLFSIGRTEALKRFLVDDGAGKDDRFWKLAQSLTALYPKDTDERRWVEAVQTYKKGLGF